MAAEHPGVEDVELPPDWDRWGFFGPESLQAELQRELQVGHKLYGVPVEPYAERGSCDDAAFRHRDDPDCITVVHLTWAGRTEIDTDYPIVEFEGTRREFVATYTRMHEESEQHQRQMREKYPHRYEQ